MGFGYDPDAGRRFGVGMQMPGGALGFNLTPEEAIRHRRMLLAQQAGVADIPGIENVSEPQIVQLGTHRAQQKEQRAYAEATDQADWERQRAAQVADLRMKTLEREQEEKARRDAAIKYAVNRGKMTPLEAEEAYDSGQLRQEMGRRFEQEDQAAKAAEMAVATAAKVKAMQDRAMALKHGVDPKYHAMIDSMTMAGAHESDVMEAIRQRDAAEKAMAAHEKETALKERQLAIDEAGMRQKAYSSRLDLLQRKQHNANEEYKEQSVEYERAKKAIEDDIKIPTEEKAARIAQLTRPSREKIQALLDEEERLQQEYTASLRSPSRPVAPGKARLTFGPGGIGDRQWEAGQALPPPPQQDLGAGGAEGPSSDQEPTPTVGTTAPQAPVQGPERSVIMAQRVMKAYPPELTEKFAQIKDVLRAKNPKVYDEFMRAARAIFSSPQVHIDALQRLIELAGPHALSQEGD